MDRTQDTTRWRRMYRTRLRIIAGLGRRKRIDILRTTQVLPWVGNSVRRTRPSGDSVEGRSPASTPRRDYRSGRSYSPWARPAHPFSYRYYWRNSPTQILHHTIQLWLLLHNWLSVRWSNTIQYNTIFLYFGPAYMQCTCNECHSCRNLYWA